MISQCYRLLLIAAFLDAAITVLSANAQTTPLTGAAVRQNSPHLQNGPNVDAQRDSSQSALFTVQLAAVTAIPKAADKLEQRAALKLTVQPQPNVSDFQDCGVIAGAGYVGSVIAQQTVAPPPGPGTTGPITTNPRTPWGRVYAKNPYRCAIGGASVTATAVLGDSMKPGDQVRLLVTSSVIGSSYYSLSIEDTYQMTAQSSGPVNFPRIVVGGAFVGNDPNYIYANTLKAVKQMPNGALVGFQATIGDVAGSRLVCNYKPRSNGQGAGTISCPPGLAWPLRQ